MSTTEVAAVKSVALVGSQRFREMFREVQAKLESYGVPVRAPDFDWIPQELSQKEEAERMQDVSYGSALSPRIWGHIRNIQLGDAVYLLNIGGYVGFNTALEIAWARALGKPVFAMEPSPLEPALQEFVTTVVDLVSLAEILKSGKWCDQTSAGVVLRDGNGRILLLERKKFPIGFACPAGHAEEARNFFDALAFRDAAIRETQEEVGLRPHRMWLAWEGLLPNHCRRVGGHRHYWRVYQASDWDGVLTPSKEETKGAAWRTPEEIHRLADRTKASLRGCPEPDWNERPGLEPVWLKIFQMIGIL